MKFLSKYKSFESVSLSYVQSRQREGCKVIGYQAAMNLFQHIGKQVLFDGDEKGKLIDLIPIQKGKLVRYYGKIERVRGPNKFYSKRLVGTLEKI